MHNHCFSQYEAEIKIENMMSQSRFLWLI